MHTSSQLSAGARTAEKCYVTSDVRSAGTDHAVLGTPVHLR